MFINYDDETQLKKNTKEKFYISIKQVKIMLLNVIIYMNFYLII